MFSIRYQVHQSRALVDSSSTDLMYFTGFWTVGTGAEYQVAPDWSTTQNIVSRVTLSVNLKSIYDIEPCSSRRFQAIKARSSGWVQSELE